jgi:two-component system, LytTR family, response regulator
MGNLNCIIVEGGNHKQSHLLREYVLKTPKLTLSGRCDGPSDVYEQSLLHKTDVIFWDVKFFDPRTIRLLREAGHFPIVICIAGKQEQEKKELDLDVFCYLSKPLSYERFLFSINKAREHLTTPNHGQSLKSKRFVFIKSEYKIIKVRFEDIIFCEGMKDYTQVYIKGKSDPLLTLNNLKSFASKLPNDEFVRVHRSYIISLSHIDSISRNEIYIGKKIIPIGDSFKEYFYQIIDWNS